MPELRDNTEHTFKVLCANVEEHVGNIDTIHQGKKEMDEGRNIQTDKGTP